MSTVMVGLGVIVLVAVLIDMIVTVLAVSAGHGLMSNLISRSLWGALRWFHRRRPALNILSAAGPLVIVLVTIAWGLAFLGGWVLVFWPNGALSPTDGGTIGWLDRFDHAASLILGGTSTTVESGGQPWSTIAGVARFNGIALVSFGLAYALPVITSVVGLRATARNIAIIADSAAELAGSFDDDVEQEVEWTGEFLLALTPQLVQLTQEVKAFPIVPFFHATSPDSAMAPNLLILDAFLAGRGDADPPPTSLRRPLERAIDGLLDVIDRHFLPRGLDLPAREDDPARWRRVLLEAWCAHELWDDDEGA